MKFYLVIVFLIHSSCVGIYANDCRDIPIIQLKEKLAWPSDVMEDFEKSANSVSIEYWTDCPDLCDTWNICKNISHAMEYSCEVSVNVESVQTHGGHEHECNQCIYSTVTCKCHFGFQWQAGKCVVDKQICQKNVCHNGGECVLNNDTTALATKSAFSCKCTSTYKGKYCETSFDPCVVASNDINSTAKCGEFICKRDPSSFKYGYTCLCPNGYHINDGNQVRACVDIDECTVINNPCKNNATCTNKIGTYECKCPPEYYGKNCEHAFSMLFEWEPWGDWYPCTVTCGGGGVHLSYRMCRTGNCIGSFSRVISCASTVPCTQSNLFVDSIVITNNKTVSQNPHLLALLESRFNSNSKRVQSSYLKFLILVFFLLKLN